MAISSLGAVELGPGFLSLSSCCAIKTTEIDRDRETVLETRRNNMRLGHIHLIYDLQVLGGMKQWAMAHGAHHNTGPIFPIHRNSSDQHPRARYAQQVEAWTRNWGVLEYLDRFLAIIFFSFESALKSVENALPKTPKAFSKVIKWFRNA